MRALDKRLDAFTLTEGLMASLAIMIAIAIIGQFVNRGSVIIQQRAAASHLTQISQAANDYLLAMRDTLLGTVTATSGPVVTVDDLINAECLPEGFGRQNVWAQDYLVYIRAPRTDELMAITLTTGGQGTPDGKFASTVVPGAALIAGGAAGFVPTGLLPGQTQDSLQGVFGGYTLNLANYNIPSPGPGHLGALSAYESSAALKDYLYRVAVPGHPELNAMQTDLDMSDHAIRGIEELQMTSHDALDPNRTCNASTEGQTWLVKDDGLYLCRNGILELLADTGNSVLMQQADLVAHNQLVEKPTCKAGTEPQIFVSPSIVSSGPETPPMASYQAWAINHDATHWQVKIRVLTAEDDDTWLYPGSDYARAVAIATCIRPEAVTP